MSGGFGAGFLKGAALALLGVGALSLAMPLPAVDPGKTSQVDLATPAGSGFNAARSDTNPILPSTDQTVVKEDVTKPAQSSGDPGVPEADTATAAQPGAQSSVEMPTVAPGENSIALATPSSGDSAPATAPAALGVPMPEIDNPISQIPLSGTPQIENQPTTEIAEPPKISETPPPETGQQTTAVIGAPTDNTDNTDNTGRSGPQKTVPVLRTESVPAVDPAPIRQNRVLFENPDKKPLLSVILIDAGDAGLDNEVLKTFSFPVTFAIDPDAADATVNAKILSAAGFEVLALAPAKVEAAGAATPPTEVAVALANAFARIPEAVGLVDRLDAKIQSDPKLADQVIANLQKTGHGLVTYDIGLNGTDQKARHAGLFSGTVYRVLDGERESGTVIKRYLDRAVLEAGKTGKVIVIGRTYPETVTALFSWAVSAKSATVALAPISVPLLSR